MYECTKVGQPRSHFGKGNVSEAVEFCMRAVCKTELRLQKIQTALASTKEKNRNTAPDNKLVKVRFN